MGFRLHDVAVLIFQRKDGKAQRAILAAYVEARCSMTETAKLLGCGRNTLRDWIDALDMQGVLDEAELQARREGWRTLARGGRKLKGRSPAPWKRKPPA